MDPSLFISALALLASAYSIFEARRNNRLGQSPVIVGHESEGPTEYSFSISNKGSGPAYFEKVQYFLNLQPIEDKPIRESIREILHNNKIRHNSSITNLGQKTVIAAGEEITLAKIAFRQEDSEKFQNLDQELAVRIVYRSSHGEEKVWSSDSRLENI